MFAVLFGLISFFGPATDCVLDNPKVVITSHSASHTSLKTVRDDTAAYKTSYFFFSFLFSFYCLKAP